MYTKFTFAPCIHVPQLLVGMCCCEVHSVPQELTADGSMQPPAGYTWTSLESFAAAGSLAVLRGSENEEPQHDGNTCNAHAHSLNDALVGSAAKSAQSQDSDCIGGAKGENLSCSCICAFCATVCSVDACHVTLVLLLTPWDPKIALEQHHQSSTILRAFDGLQNYTTHVLGGTDSSRQGSVREKLKEA